MYFDYACETWDALTDVQYGDYLMGILIMIS